MGGRTEREWVRASRTFQVGVEWAWSMETGPNRRSWFITCFLCSFILLSKPDFTEEPSKTELGHLNFYSRGDCQPRKQFPHLITQAESCSFQKKEKKESYLGLNLLVSF